MQKRRLEMLPEVLPKPEKLAPRGDVRARTMQHMQRMVATATALGAAASCAKSDTTTTQTVTVPSASTTAPATATATTPPHASATATATATTVPTVSGPPDTGYAVVDPMPMPSRCQGAAGASRATASFVQQGKDLVLKINVKLGGGATWNGNSLTPYAGVVKNVSANATKDTLDIILPATTSGVGIPVHCPAGDATVSAEIASLPAKPKVGDSPAVSLYDRSW